MGICRVNRLIFMILLTFFLISCSKNVPLYVDQMEVTEEELALWDGDVNQAARAKHIQKWVEEEGLAQPVSYEELMENLEEVNGQRVKEKENGGVIYGVVEYTPFQYYHIVMGEYERLLKNQLMQQAEEVQLRAYYKENQDSYRQIGTMEGRLTIFEENRMTGEIQVQIDRYNVRAVSEKDEVMVSHLLSLEEGETVEWQDNYGRTCRLICTKREQDSYESYEEAEGAVLEQYASAKLEQQLVQRMGASNIQDLRTDKEKRGHEK